MHINPTQQQMEAFGGTVSAEGPVFMLNLLRFKEEADAIDDGEAISGAAAYARYAQETAPHLARVGGEVVWAGLCDAALIGPADREWDIAAVVRYPSRAAFLKMVRDPEYLKTAEHRTSALADSRLVPCVEAKLGA
jgi:uncharacterized protein (DUF1330 family)